MSRDIKDWVSRYVAATRELQEGEVIVSTEVEGAILTALGVLAGDA